MCGKRDDPPSLPQHHQLRSQPACTPQTGTDAAGQDDAQAAELRSARFHARLQRSGDAAESGGAGPAEVKRRADSQSAPRRLRAGATLRPGADRTGGLIVIPCWAVLAAEIDQL